MSIPHRCPICEGRGEVGKRLAQTGAELISKNPLRFACHGCAKTGIIWDHSFKIDIQTTPAPAPNPFQPIITPLPYYPPHQWPPNDTTTVSLGGGVMTANQPELVTDHICSSHRNPPAFCKYCFDQRRYNGSSCSCSPEGMPHSEECKGYFPGALSKEQFEAAAQK